jgi:hypothetical protein
MPTDNTKPLDLLGSDLFLWFLCWPSLVSFAVRFSLIEQFYCWAFSREHCGIYNRCWAKTSKQTTGQQPSLCNDREMSGYIRPFLDNGLVNTFPRQWLHLQRGKRHVVYAVRAYLLTYLLMYGAEPFLRSCQLCSHSGNSLQF